MARNAKNTRMCASCRKRFDKSRLVHICKKKDGTFIMGGLGKSLEGRGMYLCPDMTCVEAAVKRKCFSRNLRCEVPDGLIEEIENYVKSLSAE